MGLALPNQRPKTKRIPSPTGGKAGAQLPGVWAMLLREASRAANEIKAVI